MRTSQDTWTVARQIAFFAPVDMKGKWHAAWLITHTAVCGTPVDLGQEVIHATGGQESNRIHPIVCKRCVRLSTSPGVSALGIER